MSSSLSAYNFLSFCYSCLPLPSLSLSTFFPLCNFSLFYSLFLSSSLSSCVLPICLFILSSLLSIFLAPVLFSSLFFFCLPPSLYSSCYRLSLPQSFLSSTFALLAVSSVFMCFPLYFCFSSLTSTFLFSASFLPSS